MNTKIVKEWITESGLKAYVVVGLTGTYNGYVAVDKDSPYYELDYYVGSVDFDDLDKWDDKKKCIAQAYLNEIEVHGGLTFSGNLLDTNECVFGFDCSHAWDHGSQELALETFPEEKKYIDTYFNVTKPFMLDASFKDLDYVVKQCEKLADQLMTKES